MTSPYDAPPQPANVVLGELAIALEEPLALPRLWPKARLRGQTDASAANEDAWARLEAARRDASRVWLVGVEAQPVAVLVSSMHVDHLGPIVRVDITVYRALAPDGREARTMALFAHDAERDWMRATWGRGAQDVARHPEVWFHNPWAT